MRTLTRSVIYPESPRWIQGRVWFSDVHDYRLKAVDLEGRVETLADAPGRPAGMGVLPDGAVLIATARNRKLNVFDPYTGLLPVNDLASFASGYLNDMVVDGRGNAYVADIGFRPGKGDRPVRGRIILRTYDGWVRVAAEDLDFPNGMAVSDDGQTLYLAETTGRRITSFAVGADGSLSGRKLVASLDFYPDGICLDDQGGIWVGGTTSEQFVRVLPDGSISQKLDTVGRRAVACVFGGENRSWLVLTTAETTDQRLAQGLSHGQIDIVDVAHTGGGRP